MPDDRDESRLGKVTDGEDVAADPPGDGGAGLVFWLLVAMAVATFAPCMILPAWREYQAAELNARIGAYRVAEATAEVERARRRLDAVHNDPAVVARLARRELAFRAPGEELLAVPISGGVERSRSQEPVDYRPVEPPVAVSRLTGLLPSLDYDALFCESPTRETILGMSTLLFIGAFVIFWPRRAEGPS